MIVDHRDVDAALEILRPDSFYNFNYRAIYEAIVRLHDAGEPITETSISTDLQMHGVKDVGPYDVVEASDRYGLYTLVAGAKILENLRQRREMQILGERIRQAANSFDCDVIQTADQYSADLLKVIEGGDHDVKTLADEAREVYDTRGQKVSGVKTGYIQIDDYGGLPSPGFVVIGGGTSQGKSAFVLNLSLYAARCGHKIAYYSLEMPDASLTTRILANISKVPSSDIRLNRLDLSQQASVNDAVEDLAKDVGKRIFFDDTRSTSLDMIKQSIRHMHRKHGVDVAVIDHMHILNIHALNNKENQEQLLARAAGELFDIAQECGITVISLAQFNREDDSTAPTLSRLRGSGQIAEAADMVLLLYRPEHYNNGISYPMPFGNVNTHNTVMCKVAKFRDGATNTFIMGFDPEISLFTPLDQFHLPQATSVTPSTWGRRSAGLPG